MVQRSPVLGLPFSHVQMLGNSQVLVVTSKTRVPVQRTQTSVAVVQVSDSATPFAQVHMGQGGEKSRIRDES